VIIKYVASGWGREKIQRVLCDRETEKSVFISNPSGGADRFAKKSEYKNYFDTFEEAKNFLINKSQLRINTYRAKGIAEEKSLVALKELKE
jgi:hypothetical protein